MGASESLFAQAYMAHGIFAKLKEGMLSPGEPMRGATDWRNVPIRHLWGDHSTWETPWGTKLLDEQLEQAKNAGKGVRDIVLVRFKGANHFVSHDRILRLLSYSSRN